MAIFETIRFAGLLIAVLLIGYLIGRFITKIKFKQKIPELRDDAIKQSRAVLSGQFSEQIAPYLPNFPYKPTESRFIGKPIDFIVFKGMDQKKVDEVVFVEVKSGQSKLSEIQRNLKKAIENKKVSWYGYKVPEEVTKGK